MSLLVHYWPALLKGALVSVSLAGLAWLIGIVTGFAVGLLVARSYLGARLLAGASFAVGAIPALAILFWLHYPAQQVLGVVIDPFVTSLATLSLLNTVFVASFVTDSANRLAKEYLEAAFVHSWHREDASRLIELPLVIRASASRIISTQVLILHMTLFASMISLDELFRTAQRINSIEFDPVVIYTWVAVFYFVLSSPLILAASYVDRRYGRDFSER